MGGRGEAEGLNGSLLYCLDHAMECECDVLNNKSCSHPISTTKHTLCV